MIDDEGNQVGMMKTPDAVKFAQERDLDLVEVAPEAKPPVCRVLDYSKYKYEQAQKVKQARKHQQQITIREIKFRPKIAQHDYDTKKHHVERFLRHKDKVKITIMFRGREVTHPERGVMILDRLAEELGGAWRGRAASHPGRAQHDDDARALQGGARRQSGWRGCAHEHAGDEHVADETLPPTSRCHRRGADGERRQATAPTRCRRADSQRRRESSSETPARLRGGEDAAEVSSMGPRLRFRTALPRASAGR